jgi:hypothetical protein
MEQVLNKGHRSGVLKKKFSMVHSIQDPTVQQEDNRKAGEEERANMEGKNKRKADMEERRKEKAEEAKKKEAKKQERERIRKIAETEKEKKREMKQAKKDAAATKIPRFFWTETASLQVCGIL